MKLLIILSISIISFSALAEQRIQKLFSSGEIKAGHVSLFLDDGEIVHFPKSNSALLHKVRSAFNNFSAIDMVKISSNSGVADIIADIKVLSIPRTTNSSSYENSVEYRVRPANTIAEALDFDRQDPSEFGKISRLNSYDEAQVVMDAFNAETHNDSQCYNRATMWTYETQVKKEINLGKIWIFFTRKYISDYNYKWWFHVAPYANVNGGKYILDRGFTRVPYTVKNWKNIFVKSGASCPVIKDYRDYEDNQKTQDCYVIFSNQYYWQPYTLENLSKRGQAQKNYRGTNLTITYNDALRDKWDGRIPLPQPEDGADILKLGESVISTTGVRGRVVKLYSNREDLVDVKYEGYRDPRPQLVRDLAVLYGSSSGFHVGSTVYTKSRGKKGKVMGVFRDGRLSIRLKRSQYYVTFYPDQLVRW